uniref:Uncharacterized protein n=1 Tax=Oryza punctata TaxID=4537 RepID=A0A0E0KB75_ORYPU
MHEDQSQGHFVEQPRGTDHKRFNIQLTSIGKESLASGATASTMVEGAAALTRCGVPATPSRVRRLRHGAGERVQGGRNESILDPVAAAWGMRIGT